MTDLPILFLLTGVPEFFHFLVSVAILGFFPLNILLGLLDAC